MIFLKKLEAKGFKSYADHVKLNFDVSLTGIVGPNGAGKSNVIDAVKWVLGEKSMKALRGKKSDDIIFHGSVAKPASEFAEVTLTFDNTNRILHIEKDTVAVTRRLYRGTGTNEYFINGEQTLLRDITDIFTDTGLSKGSLGIISQGTVNWFADSKPEDRRTIFEEAAGIGRYTRKKDEALRQLERTQMNLNRLQDLCKELSRDIKKLETQAKRVKEYKQKHDELSHLELHILTKDVAFAQSKLSEVNEILNRAENHRKEVSPLIGQSESEIIKIKESISESENRIERFSGELAELNSNINKLEVQKAIFDKDINRDITSKDYQTKVNALVSSIKSLQADLKSKRDFLEFNSKELIEFESQHENLMNHGKLIHEQYLSIFRETANDHAALDQINRYISSKPNQEIGTKAILGNKDALSGILGTVLDYIKIEEQYENAILIALGRNVNNVIVNTNRDAKRGIDFLISNRAGTCTFMPAYEMKPKPIKHEHLEILTNLPGFIDVASNLIKTEKKIKPIFEVLLGRTIIAKDFDSATNISKYIFQLYKIITLDGQIINPQGSITGGFAKASDNNLLNAESRKKELIKKIERNTVEEAKLVKQRNEVEHQINVLRSKITERKANEAKYQDGIMSAEKQLVFFTTDYENFTKTKYDDESDGTKGKATSSNEFEKLTAKLNNYLILKARIENDLNQHTSNRKTCNDRIVEIEEKLHQMRSSRDEDLETTIKYQKEQSECMHIIETIKKKFNEEYKISIEHALETYKEPLTISDSQARQKIERLRKDIQFMGNINMDAIAELEEKETRYSTLKKEEEEIAQAKATVLETITELDTKAHDDFKKTIDLINEELPKTFAHLFGGGTCKIQFTDNTDILTAGIEILASPPGKHVNSLFALSGGEKTLVALSVLFSILKISSFPLVILDEAESALDPSNVKRFGKIIRAYSSKTQFIVITHRALTMEECDKLYGATMFAEGVTTMFTAQLKDAQQQFGAEDNSESEVS